MPKELIEIKPDVLCDLTEQYGRDIAALMKGHSRASAFQVPKLLMRTALANFNETKRNEYGDDFTRFENRDVSHRLSNGDVLNSDKLGFEVRLAVFEEHCDDFLEVLVDLVKGFALRMCTGESRYEPDKQFGLWATFNYSRVNSHDRLRHFR